MQMVFLVSHNCFGALTSKDKLVTSSTKAINESSFENFFHYTR